MIRYKPNQIFTAMGSIYSQEVQLELPSLSHPVPGKINLRKTKQHSLINSCVVSFLLPSGVSKLSNGSGWLAPVFRTRCRSRRCPRCEGCWPRHGSWSCTHEPWSPDRSAASGSSPGPAAAQTLWHPSWKTSAL